MLELHTGTYKSAVTITAPSIVIEPAGDGPVTIDGRCMRPAIETIAVRADGVTIEGGITVVGGLFYAVKYVNVLSGILDGLTLKNTCQSSTFGVELQRTGPVRITSKTVSGFDGAGIHVGSVTEGSSGPLPLEGNTVIGNATGILVENSSGIRILSENVLGNKDAGIEVKGSSLVVIKHVNARSDGTYAIVLDEGTTQSKVMGSTAKGSIYDLSNLGTQNCFKRDRFRTFQGDISC